MLPENENDPQSHPSMKPMSYNDWPDDMTGATPVKNVMGAATTF